MSSGATSTRFLNPSRDGDFTTTLLGSLVQCLTALLVKAFFPISNLNLPWRNLRPFPHVEWRWISHTGTWSGPGGEHWELKSAEK